MRSHVSYPTSDFYRKVEEKIDSDFPVILGLLNHPKYNNHWVVATGYNLNSSGKGHYTVNDGWGNTGISISSNYTDGCVTIKV